MLIRHRRCHPLSTIHLSLKLIEHTSLPWILDTLLLVILPIRMDRAQFCNICVECFQLNNLWFNHCFGSSCFVKNLGWKTVILYLFRNTEFAMVFKLLLHCLIKNIVFGFRLINLIKVVIILANKIRKLFNFGMVNSFMRYELRR